MFAHPVIDQTINRQALDPLGVAVFAAGFNSVARATRRRAVWGVVALVLTDPFAFYRDVGGTTLTVPKFVLLGMLVGLALDPAIRAQALGALRSAAVRPLAIGLSLILGATALSIVQADHRGAALRETLKALEYCVVFASVVVALRTDPGETPIRATLCIALGLVALLALSQEIFGAPSGLWFYNHPIPRIAGPLEGPNQLSGYLGILLPVVAAYALLRRPHPLELASLAFGTMALMLTLSRAGTAASLAALALVLILAPSPRRRTVAAALLAGVAAGLSVVAVFGSTGLFGRFSSLAEVERPGGVGTRAELWRAAFALWKQHPLFGIGGGNFELEIAKVGPRGVRTHANSLYLQALVEGGLPLLGATVWTVVASITTFARGPFGAPLVLGALASSVGLASHQIFDLLVFYPKVGAMWTIVLALGVAELARLGANAPATASARTRARLSARMGPSAVR